MLPKYQLIKSFILEQISAGLWQASTRIASENELSERFSVSRMTARKAVDELCLEGALVRSQGLGTFVADSRPVSSMLEIHNIADEIKGRGHEYSSQVISLEAREGDEVTALLLGIKPGKKVFHSEIVHFENGLPIQYEDRLVNPKFAKAYLKQDFSRLTPNAYLSEVAPLTEADHIVEAILPETHVAKLLKIKVKSPCLRISRKTWSRQGVVSFAYLTHPGDRYRLGNHLNF